MKEMLVALTMMNVAQGNIATNKKHAEQLIEEACNMESHFIIFPEMTLSGYTRNVEAASDPDIILFFERMSLRYPIIIGFGCAEDGYNKFICMEQGKRISEYSKIHPFSYGEEEKYYKKGNTLASVNIHGFSFGMFICYDLRFPEVFTESAKENDGFIIIANWPASRVEQWKALLRARAIENQKYVLGINRVGTDGTQEYTESTFLFTPDGMEEKMTKTEEVCYGGIFRKKIEDGIREFSTKNDRRVDLYKEFYHE